MIDTTATIIDGSHLSIEDIFEISRRDRRLSISSDAYFRERLEKSIDVVRQALENRVVIYGINTNFGGLANSVVSEDHAAFLQENLLWGLKCGVGTPLPVPYVRAAMLILANTRSKGASGIRPEIIDRLATFLNEGLTPVVKDVGSIGASGDLIPLAHIAGAVIGLDPCFLVRRGDQTMDCVSALNSVGLEPLRLLPKEGLALINGTSMMSGIAALTYRDTKLAIDLALWVNALFFRALEASPDSFDPFVHELQPHQGQKRVAGIMRSLVAESASERRQRSNEELAQDRYSTRCIPQFFGPLLDGLGEIERHIVTQINSADDNPLVDIEKGRLLQAGNFYGGYIGIGMDQLRQYVAMTAKQLDAQISLLVVPEFSKGLPPSLAIEEHGVRFGLKGLQICANSILPRLLHLANPIATLFPTHAEQFNQNINSQGFNSALLAAEALGLFRQHLAASLIFGVQSVELRAKIKTCSYDARAILSELPRQLYELVYESVGRVPLDLKPLVGQNFHTPIDEFLQEIATDLENANGRFFGLIQKYYLSSSEKS